MICDLSCALYLVETQSRTIALLSAELEWWRASGASAGPDINTDQPTREEEAGTSARRILTAVEHIAARVGVVFCSRAPRATLKTTF